MDGRLRPWVCAVLLAAPVLIGFVVLAFVPTRLTVLVVAVVVLAWVVAATSWLTGWTGRRSHLAGVLAERAEARRALHDGPLQTLEAIALEPPFAPDAALELDRVRSAARAEAARIRTDLQASGTSGTSLAEQLAAVAAEFGTAGLAVQFTVADHARPTLTADQHAAVCAATREALTNVVKHADTATAVVRLDGDSRTVRVVVRDHGAGMAPSARAGFGQSESLIGRMNAVGGRAEIWSRPGRGTRVTLEVVGR